MADLKTCICCGAQSHRDDWIMKSGSYVACDRHSDDEMKDAIAKAEAPAPISAVKPIVGKVAPAGQTAPKSAPMNPPPPPATAPANTNLDPTKV